MKIIFLLYVSHLPKYKTIATQSPTHLSKHAAVNRKNGIFWCTVNISSS